MNRQQRRKATLVHCTWATCCQGMCSSMASRMPLIDVKLPQPSNFQHPPQSMAGLTPKSAGIFVYAATESMNFTTFISILTQLNCFSAAYGLLICRTTFCVVKACQQPTSARSATEISTHFRNSCWLNIMIYTMI